jgi:hypothetical protein
VIGKKAGGHGDLVYSDARVFRRLPRSYAVCFLRLTLL